MIRIIAATIVGFVLVGCGSTVPERPDALGKEKVTLQLPAVDRWELPNGLVVHYLHDPELPIMRGSLMLPGGSLFDPLHQAGLASLTGGLMREGSVRGMTPDVFDARLDELGAAIESSFGDEFGTVKFYSLSSDFKEVFGLFARVVREPAFDGARLALVKQLSGEGIDRRRDDPNTMASMMFSLALYGPHTPYSQWVTKEALQKISSDDLRKFHAAYVRPNFAHLSLTGSLTRQEVSEAIEREFGSWLRTAAPKPVIPSPAPSPKPAVYVLERDFVQSSILMGHIGPPRKTEDQHAMTIYNRIFGQGGFGTILLSEIRTKLGYVYSIYGGLFPGAVAGAYQIELQSRNETTVAAIKRVNELIQESSEKEPTAEQLGEAKDTVSRSFVFKFDGSEALVSRRSLLEFWEYPIDFDDKYLEKVGLVSGQSVLGVAKKWVKPSEVVVVIVGGVKAESVAAAFADSLDVYRVTFDAEPKIGAKVLAPASS